MAWALGRTLPEFEDLSQEAQDWAVATWRVELKLRAIEIAETYGKDRA